MSAVSLIAAVIAGDAAMLAVVGASKRFMPGGEAVAWFAAVVVVAVGAYAIFGETQIRAWAKNVNTSLEHDPRTRYAVRRFGSGKAVAFVIGSAIGGPLGAGWYFGRRRHPQARLLTFVAAWILALLWCSLYFGVLSVLF